MKILCTGHHYELDSFEGTNPQTIQFIEKVKDERTGGLVTINDGTTNEELLRVLIDRIAYLNGKFQCHENDVVLDKLNEALMWLNKRTMDRQMRNVEGKAAI